ncbi:MAG: isocitrate/isopropylmalate dehydrogenase family protein [Candidatus Iainarchaeum archaeon]|uniref:Isocitrate/isopropylmalate dehydrogenase family protein n=1 Tax=Candidatus Iainarchaeum sp. TaxID=3101447 RepID=A0A7T9DK23_9ARCH|nr:MAG: isocitrate/isopropylmalate dehydrogenase family protein [Candidatus Diapherotrites archaeon]
MVHDVVLITGDGTGPELAAATRKVLDATGVKFNWIEQEAGIDVFEKTGDPFPDTLLETIKKHKVALKAPITTPVGGGFRSVNVKLRKDLDLYQNLRPAKSYDGVRSRYENLDLVIFRENTDDVYVGIEFEAGKPETHKLIEMLRTTHPKEKIPEDIGISIKPISRYKTERIVTAAFEYAVKHGRKKVTCVHKANIMKFTDGLFLAVAREVAQRYPQIQFEDVIVDNMCMQLVQKPEVYDVLVLPNLYGDIVSDLCAGLVGGLGVAPGANIGEHYSIFEAVHGSAPKYKGMNKVNPTAMLLSGVMMLRHLGELQAADKLEKAIAHVIQENKHVTYDLKPKGQEESAVGTREMADAIIAAYQKMH